MGITLGTSTASSAAAFFFVAGRCITTSTAAASNSTSTSNSRIISVLVVTDIGALANLSVSVVGSRRCSDGFISTSCAFVVAAFVVVAVSTLCGCTARVGIIVVVIVGTSLGTFKLGSVRRSLTSSSTGAGSGDGYVTVRCIVIVGCTTISIQGGSATGWIRNRRLAALLQLLLVVVRIHPLSRRNIVLTGDLIVIIAGLLLMLLLSSATGRLVHLSCLLLVLLVQLMTGLEWLRGTRHIIIATGIRGIVIISKVMIPLSLPLALSVWAKRHALLELKLLLVLLLLCHHCSIHGSQVRVHLLILHLLLLLLLLLQVWRDEPSASCSPSSSKAIEVKGGSSIASSSTSRKEASSSSSSCCCRGRGRHQPVRLRWYQPILPARGNNSTNLAAVAHTAAATAVIAITATTAAACGAACRGSGVSRWALSLGRPLTSYGGSSLNSRTATTTCYQFRSCWWYRRYLTNSNRRCRHLHLHGEVRGWVERHR
mmetsp:Transcript_18457/g.31996  ORF Transcript_18457/g.31996 Transcript_18457/m.31996 type:complete len:485 (+) Transcript_18457:1194-2648(+)